VGAPTGQGRTCAVRARCAALAAAVLAGFLLGCASPGPDRLYRDLGGEPGVEALVDALLNRLADDPRIVHHFRDTRIARLRAMLIEQICDLSGGPCQYSGDTMLQAHAGMNLSQADFNALVEDLIDAMEERGLPVTTQNRLLALLAPMHADVVRH
jgi:hemoglobin